MCRVRLLLVGSLLLLVPIASVAQPQSDEKPSPSLIPRLSSPRQTLRTLYLAVEAYPTQPDKITDALACLSSGSERESLTALQLEEVLSRLAMPLNSVPTRPDKARVVLHETRDGSLALQRDADGLWRFDTPSLEALPRLFRALPPRQTPTADWREGYHSPRASLRSFLSELQSGNPHRASISLDLRHLSSETRRDQRPRLAYMLGFVLQRRGYVFLQEVPDETDGPAWTWHADKHGRIQMEQGRSREQKAWLFTRETVTRIEAMYQAVKHQPADPLYKERGFVLSPLGPDGIVPVHNTAPPGIASRFRSPRAVLKGLFSAIEDGQSNDARLREAAEFLDLGVIRPADRPLRGPRLATQLDAILKGLQFSLDDVPDAWRAGPQTLGAAQGFPVEIVRTDTGWHFSEDTVRRIPAMYLKLPAKVRQSRERARRFDSPRETMNTFLQASRNKDWDLAVRCLDLKDVPLSVQNVLAPVLAAKLRYILDRLGRVYLPGIPDDSDGARYVHYSGELGRLVIAPRAKEEGDTNASQVWAFSPATVKQIENMFCRTLAKQQETTLAEEDDVHAALPTFWEMPALRLRAMMPSWLRVRALGLELYQVLGLGLILVVAWALARGLVGMVNRPLRCMLLRWGVSGLSRPFIAGRLRPLAYALYVWLGYALMPLLDVPMGMASVVLPLQKFFLAALGLWAALRLVDLLMAVYSRSERLRDYRGLSDMVVPGAMRAIKTGLAVLCLSYVVFQVGGGEWLLRLLTALGVLGVAASLAAQDSVKNFFGTMTLIGERPFKIGDWIEVGSVVGVVEEVTFRATRLRGFDGEMLTMPNATLITTPVVNKGGKAFRVFRTRVELARNDTDTARDVCEVLRPRIHDLAGVVVRKANCDVSFADEVPAVRITVVYLAPDESRETKVREQVEQLFREAAEPRGLHVRLSEAVIARAA